MRKDFNKYKNMLLPDRQHSSIERPLNSPVLDELKMIGLLRKKTVVLYH